MDGAVLGLYLFATFIGGLVSGLAGFALGLVVSGVWLHILTPLQAAFLMAGYGIFTQGYGIWKLRHALSWRKAAPFIVGSALGVPVGTMLLTVINPAYLRTGIGFLLVIYSVYGLAKPVIKPMQSGTPMNVGVGFLNGLLGGLTGLAGVIVAVWSQLQGWPKDQQRTITQPVLFAALAMSTLALVVAGGATVENAKLFALGLPVLLAGLWTGFWLYGRLDDAAFRKLILVLLLVSGVALIVPMR
ncbi:MAG: sulfite exporter TauE/SafE family protein [Rhizobiales bacterium]|nr:sulfite exporter TauE/SafE family protein [Hyphomicrobiales bacterium]